MLLILFISLLALIVGGLMLYAWQRASLGARVNSELPAPRAESLFIYQDAGEALADAGDSNRRAELIDRARRGDLTSLDGAVEIRDAKLYSEVLDALVESTTDRQEEFAALVSHISKSNEMRGNKELAQRLIETWKTSPDRRSTTEMIHIAALADDAATYQRAVESALEAWRGGRLSQFSASELVELFYSQFWILAPEARRGGEGYALKRALSGSRRELATTTPAR